MVCYSLILGLAVLALATVIQQKTVANAKTANIQTPPTIGRTNTTNAVVHGIKATEGALEGEGSL